MAEQIALPTPARDGGTSVEAALAARRSWREFTGVALSLTEASQLLWAADGINRPDGYRTAPSAGALYPLELYLITGNVDGVAPGVWKYARRDHALSAASPGDRRRDLARAALHQSWIAEAAAIIAVAAVPERTAAKYDARAERYVPIEVGHVAQNVYLQAVPLGLGTTIVGAFDDADVKATIGMARKEHPMCLLPIGRVS